MRRMLPKVFGKSPCTNTDSGGGSAVRGSARRLIIAVVEREQRAQQGIAASNVPRVQH